MIRPVNSGDRLQIAASDWNQLAALANAVPARAGGAYSKTRHDRNPSVIYVRNDTDDTLPPFSVLRIGEPFIMPADNLGEFQFARPNFGGSKPSASTDRVCVTLAGLEPEDVGLAVIAGVVPVRLSVTTSNDEYAAPEADVTATLKTGSTGYRILAKGQDADDEWWAYVLLDGSSGGLVNRIHARLTQLGPNGDYGWIYLAPTFGGGWTEGAVGGTAAAWVEVLETQAGNGTDKRQTWTVLVRNATGGTFTLTLTRSGWGSITTAAIAYNAGAAAIESAIEAAATAAGGSWTGFNVTVTGESTFTVTVQTDYAAYTMTATPTLEPADPVHPAYERKGEGPTVLPQEVGLDPGVASGPASIEVTETGTGVWSVVLTNAHAGTWTLTVNGDETDPIAADANAAAVEDAVQATASGGSWTVTGAGTTASPFVVTASGSGTLTATADDLVDPGDYRFDWFAGTECPGVSTPGFVVGGMNVLVLDENGCFACVQPEEC